MHMSQVPNYSACLKCTVYRLSTSGFRVELRDMMLRILTDDVTLRMKVVALCLELAREARAAQACLWTWEQVCNHVGKLRVAVRGLAMTSSAEGGGGGGCGGGFCDPGRLSEGVEMHEELPRLRECKLLRGPYLGDVSALCFLPSSPLRYLLAGSISLFFSHPCTTVFTFDEYFPCYLLLIISNEVAG